VTKRKPAPTAEAASITQHTIRVPENLEARVSRAMRLEGLRTYNDFVLSALTRRCREIERDNRIDADGRPVAI
jgi:uncharacterized protein (DUF1778 family)